MKAACKFYGADWCGILIADLRSELWRPEMWYDVEAGPMKDRYDQMAREELPEEEYQKVQHLLEIRTHKEE